MTRRSTVELPESARRFHELYRSDLSRVEPVSDAQILAAIDRGEVHDRNQVSDAGRWDIVAHLGFVHNSWTTRRLRPQIDALESAGRIRNVRRLGLDLVALTSTGRRTLGKARSVGGGFPARVSPAPEVAALAHAGGRPDRRFPRSAPGVRAELDALLDAGQAPSDS
jgi:hypothetical protein